MSELKQKKVHIPVTCSYWCSSVYFITFTEATIDRCFRRRLFIKYVKNLWKKSCGRAAFSGKLKSARTSQRFPCILSKCLILEDKFCRHFLKHAFLCAAKHSRPEAVSENWSQSVREIFDGNHCLRWCDETHEGDLEHLVYHFSYDFLIFSQMLWLYSSVK